jgi:hypothetical protein
MAKTAKAYYGYFVSFAYAPMTEWGIGSDAGAEEGSDSLQRELIRYFEYEIFVYNDLIGVASIGYAAGVLVEVVIGTC